MTELKQVSIVIFEDDGQIDVEVYEWDENNNCKGKLIEEESEYGYIEKKEANDHINRMYEQFDVVKLSSLEEEEEETKDKLEQVSSKLAPLESTHIAYEVKREELEKHIKVWFYKKYKVFVPFQLKEPVDSDGNYFIELVVDEKELDRFTLEQLEEVLDYEEGSNEDYLPVVLKEMFQKENVKSFYNAWMDTIIILVGKK